MGSDSQKEQTFGDRVSDSIAKFGGSWYYLIVFHCIMFIWIASNIVLFSHPFDPYPFILWNLILSYLAGVQGPVIMMSQNRQEIRDRERTELDLLVDMDSNEKITVLLSLVKEMAKTIKDDDVVLSIESLIKTIDNKYTK